MLTLETSREIVTLSNILHIRNDSIGTYIYKLEGFSVQDIVGNIMILNNGYKWQTLYVHTEYIIAVMLILEE